MLVELLDNARRAGANRIDVRVSERAGGSRVEVADDGHGAAEARPLLAAGTTAWRSQAIDVEHPKGRGLHCLYTRNAVIETRAAEAAGDEGWRAPVGALNFATGSVDPEPSANQRKAGLTVAFDAKENQHEVQYMVGQAARFLPTEVALEGTLCSQSRFTGGSASTVVSSDYLFGIIPRAVGTDADLSLHGRLVRASLPSVETLEGPWSVRAELLAWPDGLELDPDDRDTILDNDEANRLRQLAEKVLFEALASGAHTPGLSDAIVERAHRAGVELTPGTRLRPWVPAVEGDNGSRTAQAGRLQTPVGALVVDFDAAQPAREGQMLHRAAERGGLDATLVAPEPAARGQRWYATLPRIVDVRTKVRVGDQTHDADDEAAEPWTASKRRVDAIVVEASVLYADGSTRTLELPTDVGIGGGREAYDVEEKAVFLTKEATIDLEELTRLIAATSTGRNADGAEANGLSREQDFEMSAEYKAARALEHRDDADRRQIARAVRNALVSRIERNPDDDESIRITIRGNDVAVAIEQGRQS